MDQEMSKISDAVVDDLTFDPDVDVSGVTVEDRDGEVVVAGSVPSYPQYRSRPPSLGVCAALKERR
jgi:osmotically-inducible protein OsmY